MPFERGVNGKITSLPTMLPGIISTLYQRKDKGSPKSNRAALLASNIAAKATAQSERSVCVKVIDVA